MKKLVTLFLVMGFVAFLFGCSNESSSLYITLDDISKNEHCSVNANGQLEKVLSFDSGASLKTTEDNTLAENVVVNVTETRSYDTGLNPIGKPEFIYVYGIAAVLEDSTEVKSLKKPLTLTLPASHLGTAGICYAGVREDKSSPWKYTRLSENGISTLSQRSIRAAGSGSIRPVYEFSLYKMGIEIALFVYNKPPEEAQKDISGAGITAAPATSLLTLDENGNYCDNLDMDVKLEGDNLSSLRDSDITVSIIYRSNKSTPEEIKVNDLSPVRTETKSDAGVTVGGYVHTLTLNNSNFNASFAGEPSIKFVLGLEGISSSDFPTDFIVEVSSVDNSENLIPFTYSNNVSYKAEAVYSITYDLDGGSLAEGDTNPDRYTAASDTFTLKNPVKEGYAFAGWTGTGLSSATIVVTIEKGSTGSREYKAIWMQNAPDTYKLTVLKGTGIATVSEGGTYEAGKEITLAYTLENGYQSASWTSEDVSVDEAGKFTMPAKNVTVTANAGVITYYIAYAGLEGATFAGGVTNPKTYDVSSDTITLNNPSKTGYEFVGWTGTGIASGTASMTVTIPQGSIGDREYTANWTTVIYTISHSVNANGQFPAPITFPSGARLETTEDNTLAEDVVVNVTETRSYDTGLNPIGKPEFIYVYGITAVLEDSLGNRTEVKSLKKPLKLTLPASHLGTAWICYAGVREDKSSPWKYTRLSENGISTLSQRSIRAAGSGSIRSSYELSLYKMGIEIALFAYNKPPEEAQKDISGAGITAAPVTPLLTLDENGNYCDNLDMDIKLEGDNLSSLRDSDITVSIIYRSNKSTPEEIKINGMPPVNTETRSDAAVSGENSYVHMLTLNKNNFKADLGGETSVKFSLDLKGKSSSDFPTDFIVEVNSADNIENLIPFTYSNNVSYKAEAVYSITYDLDGGSLAEGDANPDKYTAASDTFTLKNPVKEGYTFGGWTGTGLSSATMVVTIEKGSAGSREYKAIWM